MLSIEITDRHIKLIRGVFGGNKIRVLEAEMRNLSPDMVSNGFVVDVPLVAAEISDILRNSGVKEKEAKVSITSSSVVHKEIILPKPKRIKNNVAMVGMIRSTLGVSDEYNISYTISGEMVDENKNPLIKVIASACPQRLVDGYRRLFTHLGLTLKEINLSNNSITRLIINSPKMAQRMPLLLIQVDADFLNVNLFEEQQLVFSSFFKISSSDYDDAPDYINRAVYDKLFLLLQFIKSRKNYRPLKEILFYGEIPDFLALSNAVSSFDVPAHILSVPSSVVTMCEVNFTQFANAIGALYKTNRDIEHINLLETASAKKSTGDAAYFIKVGLCAVASAGLVFGAVMTLKFFDTNIKKETTKIQTQTTNLAPDLAEVDRLTSLQTKVNEYNITTKKASDLFNFYPKSISTVKKKVIEPFSTINVGGNKIELKTLSLSGTTLVASYEVDTVAVPSDIPSKYVSLLREVKENRVGGRNYFRDIAYTGFEAIEKTGPNAGKKVTFVLTMTMIMGNDDKNVSNDLINSMLQ